MPRRAYLPATLFLALATLTACGVAAPAPVGVRAAAQGVAARSFDLPGTVERLVEDAQDADLETIAEVGRTLRELARGVDVAGSADLRDVLLFTRAHGALIREAAKHADGWMAVAYLNSTDVGKSLETIVRGLMAMRHPGGRERQFDYRDVVVALDGAADAMLDRYPTPPPAIVAKDPSWNQPEAGFRFVGLYTSIGLMASRLVRTDADVEAFQASLDGMVAKATASPAVPKSLVAKLASWAAGYRDLTPKPAP